MPPTVHPITIFNSLTPPSQKKCEGRDWCWVDDSDEAFQIKTIRNVEENKLVTV